MRLFRHNNTLPYFFVRRKLVSSTTDIVCKEDLPAAAYQPIHVENYRNARWDLPQYYKVDSDSPKPPFTMVLPPPNVTGKLHLGHALACTVQDVIARRQRALGYNVLWLPGTDHAGIATQGVVEKHLASTQNVTRQNLGRENFNKEVWKWKEQHGDFIYQQLRSLGCTLDWSRQTFTMDPHHVHAVNTAFIQLFQKGLIYRKYALVNWCYDLHSTVSDIEVDNILIDGPTELKVQGYNRPIKFGLMYSFAYRVCEEDEEVVVSTTMPETMLGDTAVAVHPEDKRYHHLHDKRLIHPFTKQTIPIIFDEFVNMDFGTGAVKITPAHSKIDYEVAKRHNLPLSRVINEFGIMEKSGIFTGLKKYDCRDQLVEKLSDMGRLKNVTPHQMTLPTCSRTGGIIEYMPKEQWFLSCTELNRKAKDAVTLGHLKIYPEKFVRNWLDWAEDDRDWCISRQLWWGHQIPAYKCTAGSESVWIAAMDDMSAKTQASKYLRSLPENIHTERDTDVLDTWFSSGIYPFSVMGWPNKTPEYFKFYPLSLMATGHDILGFWVYRMVILGLELTGQLPFHKVLLHGVICDNKGAKMSKSKGNVIDPIDVIQGITLEELADKAQNMKDNGILNEDELQKALKYHKANFWNRNGIPECGVDALRFTLLSSDVKSHYVHFDVDLCHTNKLFCNKIWQSVKYTQLSFAKLKPLDGEITQNDLTYFDKWIMSRVADMVETVNNAIDEYDFHIATRALKTLLYTEFCDFYIESTKPGFENENPRIGYAHAHTLSAVLNTALRCLSPFMIYLTEELIPKIPSFERNVIHNFEDKKKQCFDIPNYKDFSQWSNKEYECRVSKILSAIALIRQLKGFYGLSNKIKPSIYVRSEDVDFVTDFSTNNAMILNLTKCGGVFFENEQMRNIVNGMLNKDTTLGVEIVGNDIDNVIRSAKERLLKKIRKAEENVNKLELKLSSPAYIQSVPEWTQLMDKEKLLMKKEELKELQRLLS